MTKRKTDAEFKKEVYELVGDEYTFLESYINNRTKIKVKHNECDNIYRVEPASFLRGRRCPKCFGNHKKTDADFKKEVFELVGDEYVFLDSYTNNKTKLRVKHNKCGNVYKVKPNDFFTRNSRCPFCSSKANKTYKQFKQEVYDLVGDEYTVLGSYVNTNTKIKIKHNTCGTVYKVRPHTFLEGYRCPHCKSSKGELIISKILDTINIKYDPQKKFDNLKDTQPLSYDFYIPSQNILIEYQGLQHYQPIEYFGGKYQFKIQQKHDKMKADYARDHGYNLITIPYTEDTFSKIKKYLLRHGLKRH